MGGWIGFGLAHYAPEQFHALIIGGAHPYARSMDHQRQALRKALAEGKEAFVAGLEMLYGPMTPQRKARALANDLEALLAVAQDRSSVEAVLPTMTMPCLFFAGEADPVYPVVRECVKQMPNVTFFSLPDLSHAEAMARSDLVLPYITKFLATVSH
jgi:pimeloyl-ACP methyl ester carboxylesterase